MNSKILIQYSKNTNTNKDKDKDTNTNTNLVKLSGDETLADTNTDTNINKDTNKNTNLVRRWDVGRAICDCSDGQWGRPSQSQGSDSLWNSILIRVTFKHIFHFINRQKHKVSVVWKNNENLKEIWNNGNPR